MEILALLVNIVTLAYLILLAFGVIKLRKDFGEPKEGNSEHLGCHFANIINCGLLGFDDTM